MSSEIDIIRHAREIISDPARWCRGASARDDKGEDWPALSSRAVSWCAWGALVKAASDLGLAAPVIEADYAAERIRRSQERDDGWFELHVINDNEGHAAVLAIFDKALASEAAPCP